MYTHTHIHTLGLLRPQRDGVGLTVCVYAYIHVCMHTHTYIHICTHIHRHAHTHIQTYPYIYLSTYTDQPTCTTRMRWKGVTLSGTWPGNSASHRSDFAHLKENEKGDCVRCV